MQENGRSRTPQPGAVVTWETGGVTHWSAQSLVHPQHPTIQVIEQMSLRSLSCGRAMRVTSRFIVGVCLTAYYSHKTCIYTTLTNVHNESLCYVRKAVLGSKH